MIRKLLLPALAIAMLGGCVTSGYDYRGGYGDYYYGQPQVQYREYGSPYGYGGYGYGGYGGYPGWVGGYGYGDPYGYYGGYGGFYDPWDFYPRRPRVIVVRPRPGGGGHDHDHDGDDAGLPPMGRHRNDDRPPPWRDLGGTVRATPPGVRPPLQPQRPDVIAPRPQMGQHDDGDRPQRVPRSSDFQAAPGTSHERRDPDRELRRKQQP